MARYVGHRSEYEVRNAKLAWLNGSIVLIFPFLLLIIIICLLYRNFSIQFLLLSTSIYVLVYLALHFFFPSLERDFNCWIKGLNGEDRVRLELLHLPNYYTVFEDLKIGQEKGNIDFVVVGPTGIFIIGDGSLLGTLFVKSVIPGS